MIDLALGVLGAVAAFAAVLVRPECWHHADVARRRARLQEVWLGVAFAAFVALIWRT